MQWDIEVIKPINHCAMTGREAIYSTATIAGIRMVMLRDEYKRFRVIAYNGDDAIAAVITEPCNRKHNATILFRFTVLTWRGNNLTRLLINHARMQGYNLLPSEWQSESGKACYK